MKFRTDTIYLFTLLFFLTSCSNYVARVHRELDREIAHSQGRSGNDHFQQFRTPHELIPGAEGQRNPNSFSSMPTTQANQAPQVKRRYEPQAEEMRKRYKADDFIDSNPSGSLWVNDQQNSSLFTDSRDISKGDIILVNVFKKLKNEITAELKRAFPGPPVTRNNQAAAGAEAEQGPADDDVANDETKVYDRISTVVVEEINKNHVLLRGRKNLLYKNRKRLVEVQALVPRRDLSATDTVDSNSIIESSINVLR